MAKELSEINPAGIKVSRNSATPLYVQVYGQLTIEGYLVGKTGAGIPDQASKLLFCNLDRSV
jgi:hypothetical protein